MGRLRAQQRAAVVTATDLRLVAFAQRSCDGLWEGSDPCSASPHVRGRASFEVGDDLDLLVEWHYDPEGGGLTFGSIGGFAQTLVGGNLPMNDRVLGLIWDALNATPTT